MNKYGFTGETKYNELTELKQIVALVSFSSVTAGDVGGWIEKEENLSQENDSWVCGNARVF